MIRPEANHHMKDPPPAATGAPGIQTSLSPAETCARIKGLGYTASKHITIYGQHLELVSDPVEQGNCTVVQVISEGDPTIRTLRLPVSILLGLTDRAGQKTKFGKRVA